MLKEAVEDGHFAYTPEGVELAKIYLKEIKADMALDFNHMTGWQIVGLANVNWASGLREGDINEVELPDNTDEF